MAMLTELSGNELYCLAQKNFKAGAVVIGSCVNSLGLSEKIESTLKGSLGKELKSISRMLQEGRQAAYHRMMEEAVPLRATGVVGVKSELFYRHGNIEFLSSGCVVNAEHPESMSLPFSSNADGKQFYALLDAEYSPLSFVFGTVAYSTAMSGGLIGKLGAYSRGEVKPLSDTFNQTRYLALERIVQQAKENKATAVIDIKATSFTYVGVNEMLMTGTAVQHALFSSTNHIATSALSNDEMWSLAKMGYAPKQIVMGSSLFSLGVIGSITSVLKSLYLNEIPELTALFTQARKNVLEMINQKATEIQAEEVIGVRTHVYHLGNGLMEFLAIGTAIEKLPGVKTQSEQLPMQVLINKQKK